MNRSKSFIFCLAASACLLVADAALAQPGGGRGPGQDRGFFGGDNTLGLLQNPQVREELALADDQAEELEAIGQAMRESMRDMFSGMRDADPEERRQMMEDMREKTAARMQEFTDQIDQILLPHQRDRLKQIGFQMSGGGRRGGSVSGPLGNDRLLEELGVTEEQREKLEEAATKAQEELREKYAELVKEAQSDIMKILTKEQRKKYEELIGEPFEMQFGGPPEGAQRGDRGDRGDRGNRGGGRRNRNGDDGDNDFE